MNSNVQDSEISGARARRRAQSGELFGALARRRIAELPQTTGLLQELRAAGAAAFAASELPTAKTESWKYSRIGPLLETGLLDRAAPGVARIEAVPGLDAQRLVILDGVPQPVAGLDAGLTVAPLSALSGAELAVAQAHLGRIAAASGRPFVALNGALVEDGLLLRVAAGARIERPIELVIAQSADATPRGAHPRVLVLLEEGARATLVERHIGGALLFTNAVVEIALAAGARLDHLRLATAAGAGRWLGALAVAVGRDAGYDLSLVERGAAFRRNEIDIRLSGPGAEVAVRGAGLTRGAGHLDHQMNLEHAAPRCSSRQQFRLIAGETSRAILNGRIHIHPGAGKTDAELQARGLLLTRGAEIDLKPELEIYADDVKCAHGATLGQLDATALFYLRSRGIDEATARALLSFAFLGEIIAALPLAAVRELVRPVLHDAFVAQEPQS
jgi:Fe-S cluster assembly protein SufD